jgi:glycosyltransferase involved in cell wall biosynthesis
MKRVLIVTYYWPPSGGAGVQRWVKLSKYFSRKGIQVFVVTVDPVKASYALIDTSLVKEVDPSVRIQLTDTLEPYGIYKRITGKKDIPFGGFSNEENQKPTFSQRLSRFIRGNLFLPDARVGWNRYAYKACCEIIEREKIDAIITTSPPHSTQLVGLKLKKKYGLPWLADLRDPWTGIYYYEKLYLTAFSKARDARKEKKVLIESDGVMVVSKDIRDSLILKSGGQKPEKFHVVPNGFDADDFNSVQPDEKESGFVISYTGTLTQDYRLSGFLEAVQKLKETELRLQITGSMPIPIREKIKESVSERIRFRNHVSHHEAIAQMKAADMLLLVIPDAKGNKGILTGKLFEYLAARKPILCIGPVDGDAASIIRLCNAGESFDYTDGKGILHFIQNRMNLWREEPNLISGDQEQINKFSRLEQADQILGILNSVN